MVNLTEALQQHELYTQSVYLDQASAERLAAEVYAAYAGVGPALQAALARAALRVPVENCIFTLEKVDGGYRTRVLPPLRLDVVAAFLRECPPAQQFQPSQGLACPLHALFDVVGLAGAVVSQSVVEFTDTLDGLDMQDVPWWYELQERWMNHPQRKETISASQALETTEALLSEHPEWA